MAAAAAPALAARRVVVHDDAIADGDALDLGADRGDLAGQLVAEDRRHLARDPRVEDVRAAHAARQHAADDVAAARLGVRRLLDADLARRQRAGDPHASSAAMDAASGGRATPRSVTSAVTSAAGVTSKAGLRTAVPGSVASTPRERADLVAVALLDLDAVAVGQLGVDGRRRARRRRTGCRPRAAASASGIGADLVGGVAVGGHAVGAHDHRVDLAAADEPGHRAVDHELVAPRRRAPAPTRSGARPAAAAASRRRGRGRRRARAARGSPPSAVPRPPAASAPVLQCVAIRRAPASRSAPCAAIAAEAASSSAWMRSASARAAPGHRRRPGRQRRRAHAVDGVGEVDGGRPRRAQQLPARLERAEAGLARDLHRQPVGGGDPDERSPAHGQAPDGLRRVGARPRAPATPRRRAGASGRGSPGAARPNAGPGGAASRRTWRAAYSRAADRQRQSKYSRWMRRAGTPAEPQLGLEAAQHRPRTAHEDRQLARGRRRRRRGRARA